MAELHSNQPESAGTDEVLTPADAAPSAAPTLETPPPDAEQSEAKTPFVSAYSPVKRIIAWVGVCYMLILIALNFRIMSTGEPLYGLAPLLSVPAIAGFAALCWNRWKTAERRGSPIFIAVILLLCAAGVLVGLYLGLPPLLSQLGAVS